MSLKFSYENLLKYFSNLHLVFVDSNWIFLPIFFSLLFLFLLFHFPLKIEWQFCVEGTWKSACTYSSFLANKTPLCCASLSTFYNRLVTPCPQCSCGCREAKPTSALCYRCVLFSTNLLNLLLIISCMSSVWTQMSQVRGGVSWSASNFHWIS